MSNYYKISGLVVQMETFGRALAQAEPYRISEQATPDIVIRSDWKTLKEQQPHLTQDDSEYISTGSSFYYQLLNHDGMLLHASAVVMDGQAYLFSAPSGTGKSTHTQLWRKVFGEDRALILNDDKPAIHWEDGQYYAYGTPWSGSTDLNLNLRVKLAGICFLTRGEKNEIERFGGSAALFELLSQTIRPSDAKAREVLLAQLDRLIANVPIWKMACNMEDEAAELSYRVMSGIEKR